MTRPQWFAAVLLVFALCFAGWSVYRLVFTSPAAHEKKSLIAAFVAMVLTGISLVLSLLTT